jgi:hypothetical protein
LINTAANITHGASDEGYTEIEALETQAHTHTHKRTYTHIHTRAHTHTHTPDPGAHPLKSHALAEVLHARTHTHTHIHTHTHTRIHTYIHTHARTHAHTHLTPEPIHSRAMLLLRFSTPALAAPLCDIMGKLRTHAHTHTHMHTGAHQREGGWQCCHAG